MLTDLDALPVFVEKLGGKFHRGFYKQAQNLVTWLKDVHVLSDVPQKAVTFCGHSMGAAVAGICAILTDCEAYCFASPPICSLNICETFRAKIKSIVYAKDLISRIGTHQVRAFCKRLSLYKSSDASRDVSTRVISQSVIDENSLFVPGRLLLLDGATLTEID